MNKEIGQNRYIICRLWLRFNVGGHTRDAQIKILQTK